MARLFDGTNDSLQASVDLSAYNKITLAIWLWWDAFADNDELAMEFTAEASANNGGFYLDPNAAATLAFNIAVRGTTGPTVKSFTRPSAAAWHHYGVHLDPGTTGTNALPAIYVDGSSASLTTHQTNSVSGNFANSTLNFMCRNAASLFGAGRQAEVAIYGGVLLPAEDMAALAKGFSPLLIRPDKLVNYWKLTGRPAAGPESDARRANNATVSGAVITEHPRIIYPNISYPFSVPSGGGVSVALTGSSVAISTGEVGSVRFVPLLSRKLPTSSATVALTGQSLAFSQGSFKSQRTLPLTGSVVNVRAGALSDAGTAPSTINPAPVLSSIGDISLPQGATHSVAGNFSDPGDTLSYGLVEGTLPAGVTFSPTGTFSATSNATLGAAGQFVVYAEDGHADEITTFTLTTTAASGTYPFMVGLGFRRGDVTDVAIKEIHRAQVVVKKRWSDGSTKHAIVSGLAALTQNVARTLTVIRGRPAPGTSLTSANITAAAPAASVQCGAFGTVTLASQLSNPSRTWASGPEMVECHYRSEVGTSLMAVEWRVRLFADGRIWVRAWVENSYLDNGAGAFAANVDRSYTPLVTIGGVGVFNNGGNPLTHYRCTRYKAEGWIGGDPQVTAIPNVAYLHTTKLFPNYFWRSPSAATLNGLTQTYTPMGRGDIPAYMPDVGFSGHIGVLPLWDALLCTTGDVRAYRSAIANSFHLNSYGIIVRSFNSKLVPKPSDFPTWDNNGPSAGPRVPTAGALTWDSDHNVGCGYADYIVTGDYDHLETMGFNCAALYLVLSLSAGLGTARKFQGFIRGTAWSHRTLGQYCAIAPDGDAVAADYRTLLTNQFPHWKSVIDQPGASQIGIIYVIGTLPIASDPNGANGPWPIRVPSFMQWFWVFVLGHLTEIEVGFTNTDAFNAVRDFICRSIIGVLGPNGATHHCFTQPGVTGSTGGIQISSEQTQQFVYWDATDFYQTWGEAHEATYGSANTSCGNTLTGGSGAYPGLAGGWWAHAMAAAATAVDLNATGMEGITAQSSWDRLTGASNWSLLRDSGFNDLPLFGIVPRNVTVLP